MPITKREFNEKSELELTIRSTPDRPHWYSGHLQFLLDFLTKNSESAYLSSELTNSLSKNLKLEDKKSSIDGALADLIAKGYVTRRGSYYIRKV
jgi:hypothetical protein